MGDAQWSSEANVMLFDMGAVYGNWHRTIGDTQTVGCIHANAESPPPSYCLNHPLGPTTGATAAAAAVTDDAVAPPCSLCCDSAVTSEQRFGERQCPRSTASLKCLAQVSSLKCPRSAATPRTELAIMRCATAPCRLL